MPNYLPIVKDRLLKDSTLSNLLETEGYVLIDAGLEAETLNIKKYIEQHFILPTAGFYYSLLSNDFSENLSIKKILSDLFTPFYENHFKGYRTITESFLAKPANTKDELMLHQDWCYTDERRYNAYNIWVPLTDVDESNGALFFVPKSHLWFHNYRSGTFPTGRISISDVSMPIETVKMKRGQAIVFHPAIFHGSFPNKSNINRIVATSTILEKEAPFLFYVNQPEEKADIYQLSDDALLKDLQSMAMGGKPNSSAIGRIEYAHHIITAHDLAQKSLMA